MKNYLLSILLMYHTNTYINTVAEHLATWIFEEFIYHQIVKKRPNIHITFSNIETIVFFTHSKIFQFASEFNNIIASVHDDAITYNVSKLLQTKQFFDRITQLASYYSYSTQQTVISNLAIKHTFTYTH